MRLSFLLLAALAAVVLVAWARPSITPGTAIALSFRGEAADARITAIHDLSRYSLYVIESADGSICGLAGDAAVPAIPLRGHWDDRADWSPEGITLACVNVAIGKCVIWGYRPWEPGMRDYHQACIRMVRADYCGDGVGHTRDGTPIDVWDAQGSVRPDRVPGMDDEAEWEPEGATRIRHTCYASGMVYVMRHCSDRLGAGRQDRPWLLANASYPDPR